MEMEKSRVHSPTSTHLPHPKMIMGYVHTHRRRRRGCVEIPSREEMDECS
jgi:hypothetical protein